MTSMKVFIGVDLGSTTTKAVILDEDGHILGRGITNSRSNYDVACRIARDEAFIRARFTLTRRALGATAGTEDSREKSLHELERSFRIEQHIGQLGRLREELHAASESPFHDSYRTELKGLLDRITDEMVESLPKLYAEGAARKSDFFRDLASAEYMSLASDLGDPKGVRFETLCGVFDAAILKVENRVSNLSFEGNISAALERTVDSAGPDSKDVAAALESAVQEARSVELIEAETVGTGYGRQRLPFPKEQIRSEILCHGLGANDMFPSTATVLDIGGQDTKAIQVDANGIVTSFQMNDRCAAGCGRYLGYIADEMNLGLHELGPLAQQASCRVKISSTCTVFAGAELRDRLAAGQRREDILGGLHRAIILRAMSLLARSGGIKSEFTFTGGVARNPAAVQALHELVEENYGIRSINISPDSIYTGAIGAALFARMDGPESQKG
jgi:benzoyl-CoA reductase subunit A